jgi:hypothetical protein
MKTLMKLLGSAIALGSLLVTTSALADGILIAPSSLSADAKSKLEAQVASARAQQPAAFKAVASVKGHKYETYKNYRNPIPTVSRELRGLGAPALMPMLEALALNQPARGALNDAEWDALAVGMLEAVGVLRDVRARPVLLAAFESNARPAVIAAAGRALGRLGGDPELAMLTQHAVKGDARFLEAIGGLGYMRRVEAAKHLAGILTTTKDEAVMEAAADALGTLGSSWGWKAYGPKYAAQGLEVRKACAQALAPSFVRAKGAAARTAIGDGILMVDHPDTVDYLRSARPSTGAATQKAVDALVVRVERQRAKQRR